MSRPDPLFGGRVDEHGQPLVCALCGRRSDRVSAYRWVWRREEFGFHVCRRVCEPSCGATAAADELGISRGLCQQLFGAVRSLRPWGPRATVERALHYCNQLRTRMDSLEDLLRELSLDVYRAEVILRRAPPPPPAGEPPAFIPPPPPRTFAFLGDPPAPTTAPVRPVLFPQQPVPGAWV